jgi:hypothetical protein
MVVISLQGWPRLTMSHRFAATIRQRENQRFVLRTGLPAAADQITMG